MVDGVPPDRAPLPDWWWQQTVRTRQLIAAGVVMALVGLVVVLVSRTVGGGSGTPLTMARAEVFVAALPDERVAQWEALADCESGSDWSLNTGNGYYGGLQIAQETWNGVGGTGLPSNTTREEQIMRSEDIHELQGWEAWPSCSRQLGYTS